MIKRDIWSVPINPEWDDQELMDATPAESAEILIDRLYASFNRPEFLTILLEGATAIRTMRAWENYARSPGIAVDKLITSIQNKYPAEQYVLIVAQIATALSKIQERVHNH